MSESNAAAMRRLAEEPDARIVVSRRELLLLLAEADEALDGDSNDAEHDALFSVRESLSGYLEDPARRIEDGGTR